MFDWVLNRPMVPTNNHFISNFETLKVEKKSLTRVTDMNWLTNKKVTKMLVAVTAVYCINPSNVELFVHTWFHREIIIFNLVRKKNGLPL